MKILSQLCHHKGRSAASRAEMLTVFPRVLGCPSHQSHHKVQVLATRSCLQGTPFCSFCLMWGFTIWQQCPHILLKASEHCKRNNFPCHRMSPGTYFLTQESQGRKDEQNWVRTETLLPAVSPSSPRSSCHLHSCHLTMSPASATEPGQFCCHQQKEPEQVWGLLGATQVWECLRGELQPLVVWCRGAMIISFDTKWTAVRWLKTQVFVAALGGVLLCFDDACIDCRSKAISRSLYL